MARLPGLLKWTRSIALAPATGDGVLDAMRDVVAENLLLGAAQRRPDRGDLGDHVDAVAVILDHAQQDADLCLDITQPPRELRPGCAEARAATAGQRADELFGALREQRRGAAGDAVTHVGVEQPEADTVERAPHGSDLRQHVDAVAVLLEHPHESARLALDPAQAVEHGGAVGAVATSRHVRIVYPVRV